MGFDLRHIVLRKNFRATIASLLIFTAPAFARLGPNDYASSLSSIPTTADYPNNCFVEEERDDWMKDVERVSVSGCSKPIVKPPKAVTISSFYVDRSTYLCSKYREYVRTILPLRSALSDLNLATVQAADSANVLCVVNTILVWAQSDALADVKNIDGSEAITAWYLGAIAANYLKLPTVKVRAKELGHLDFILNYF
ncbi:MAG: hypothetical protein IPK04_20085 [Bdellovibrionales bacterium]|nr:hypothetical protein [Bdellovibrionales bacterium]